MKKRLLGLALVLMMIISLLPMTASADATPMPKLQIAGDSTAHPISLDTDYYITFAADQDKGMAPAFGSEVPTGDSYIKINFNGTENVLNILVKNVNYVFTNKPGTFLTFSENDEYTADYSVVVTLEGNNVFEGYKAGMKFTNNGDLTITGNGSLTINTTESSSKCIEKTGTGKLHILNTTLKVNFGAESAGAVHGIYCTKDILIEGSDVEVHAGKKSHPIRSNEGNVVVKNSDLIAELTSGANAVVYGVAPVRFENSNVTLIASTGSTGHCLKQAPEIVGTYSAQWFSYKITGEESTLKDYAAMGYVAGDAWKQGTTAGTSYNYFKLVHECKAEGAATNDCTKDIKCACGKVITPAAATEHIPGAGADDCTKDTMCGNPGCTQKYADKLGEAHVAGADDNDCTTDILCSNAGCTQVATKGAAKHVWDRANCSVDGACTTAGCTQTVVAGTHTGGTATCKAKAKCAECGEEYGELGACAPAADDGDCTTEIKCSVCGKTTTAGEAAHKYTDKNDTTCDNAGCTNTRKVEGTENPKTGDNSAIAVVAALMVTAAAAFVTTKKFAR